MSNTFNVRYVAELARIALSDAEIEQFQSQLGDVLAHVEQLRSVPVDGVEPTAHTTPVFNVFRPDSPVDKALTTAILENAPRHANRLIIVPAVIG
jgi:aspartyl-tRNA(Asn)/glutamyl-tRNA(Gln) amidotransferase subunit C